MSPVFRYPVPWFTAVAFLIRAHKSTDTFIPVRKAERAKTDPWNIHLFAVFGLADLLLRNRSRKKIADSGFTVRA